MNNLKKSGYFLIKIRKCINLYLWAETEDELFKYSSRDKYPASKGWKVVENYKDDEGKCYLKIDEKLVCIG